MKTYEITTSKGEFVVVELSPFTDDEAKPHIVNGYILSSQSNGLVINRRRFPYDNGKLICKLTEAKEEDAKLVVDEKGDRFQDYNHELCCDRWCITPLDSLQSLLKSKGIDINNGNWYLFKKLK